MATEYKFLDSAGVQHLWTKIKDQYADKAETTASLALKANAADVYAKSETMSSTAITEAINAAKYDDSTLKASVQANTKAIGTLQGEDTTKSARAIAAEEVAKIVNGAGESYDTLKEIADWISNHTTSATQMSKDINDLKTALGDLIGEEPKTVEELVDEKIAALNLDQYATDTDLATATGRITKLEGDYSSLKEQVDGLAESGGEPNVINNVKVNGVLGVVKEKIAEVTLDLPTFKGLSDEEIDAAIQAAEKPEEE